MNTRKIQFIMSVVFVVGYFFLLGMIIFIEASDSVNMKQGENSMMGEFKILIGVMTGAMAQILNFWFNKAERGEETNNLPMTTSNLQAPAAVPTPQTSVDEA